VAYNLDHVVRPLWAACWDLESLQLGSNGILIGYPRAAAGLREARPQPYASIIHHCAMQHVRWNGLAVLYSVVLSKRYAGN